MSEITPGGVGSMVGLGCIIGLFILAPHASPAHFFIVFAFYGFWAWAITFAWQAALANWKPPFLKK